MPDAVPMRLLPRLLVVLTLLLLQVLPAPAVWAAGVLSYPAEPPSSRVIDPAGLFSRSTLGELESRLESLTQDHVEARLITVERLDYGLDLDTLGHQLLERWAQPGSTTEPSQLLLLIDAQTNTAAVVASDDLLDQLPESLLRSTEATTMDIPLRQGARYRQASLDALSRLGTVLSGGEDPGAPVQAEPAPVVSNIPSREETAAGNGFTWVVVLLVVGSIVPMLTWWVFSR
jgi:uncharacterized protein